ncbi:hypothetical protein TPHA_0B02990 [Tetrapisispora phaffii CBS 4417]|uniref:[PSI+] induction protein 2 n=1 Tax=Tetrapisispora phaffii (strain ATCC 24235 / CBS 4417 / NBRC 1672 / NRRL Y-8282 / UCD 70-5) TaxID=1071381 RepID=G8BPP0_TETPH|nr:hypothetical protein TPHA_0B02990 [Tetrapisispora phaffii CBS 4417]CCE61971.1 hypothetical protein TPHA_0B02990 [Tetrapisispora phaffii CBS 4417]
MLDICLVPRVFKRNDLISTADSFKSWDTCMDNKACKIIAIVGIVLACVVALWLIGAVLTCFRQGVTGIAQFFCWCCQCRNSDNRNNQPMPTNDSYNPNRMGMPPATVIYQPIQPPQNVYYKSNNEDFYEEKSPHDVYELEQDFDLEKQKMISRENSIRRNVKKDQPTRMPPKIYESDENSNQVGSMPGAFSSKDALMHNGNFSSEFNNESNQAYGQQFGTNYNPPTSYNGRYGDNNQSFYGNGIQNSAQYGSPNRMPYPQDDDQVRYNYYPNGRY